MNQTPIKQQAKNYLTLVGRLLGSYYRQQKKNFWLIQLLMGLSVILGLLWLLGIITGLNQLNDSAYLQTYDLPFVEQFFLLPVNLWLGLLSVFGLLSALSLFLSFKLGVHSVIEYQKHLMFKCLIRISEDSNNAWLNVFQTDPRIHIHQIIKTGVQLVGLVARRTSRVFIPAITFVFAFVALLKLDAQLLLFLLPLTVLYVVALYFINRNASRNQILLGNIGPGTMHKLGGLVNQVLDEDLSAEGLSEEQTIKKNIKESSYEEFSHYRYKRRLAEIHVTWLNSIFLVLGSAVLIILFKWIKNTGEVDWMNLVFFLVALRYAAASLQQIASATVGFSRFLPETEKVFRLLHSHKIDRSKTGSGTVFYLSGSCAYKSFDLKVLKHHYKPDRLLMLDELISDQELLLKQGGIASNETVLVCSNKAKLFYQYIKAQKNAIDKIVVATANGIMSYKNIDDFIERFDPAEYRVSKAATVTEMDEF